MKTKKMIKENFYRVFNKLDGNKYFLNESFNEEDNNSYEEDEFDYEDEEESKYTPEVAKQFFEEHYDEIMDSEEYEDKGVDGRDSRYCAYGWVTTSYSYEDWEFSWLKYASFELLGGGNYEIVDTQDSDEPMHYTAPDGTEGDFKV